MEFACDGRPFLEYRSVSWILDENNARVRRSATESGYWRPRPDNGVEFLLAHPTGFVEVWVGHVEVTGIHDARVIGARIELTTDAVVRTESAKEVTAGHRLYGLVDGKLLSTYDMAAMGAPDQQPPRDRARADPRRDCAVGMDQARPDWDARLRSVGLRSTAQRRAVLQALFEARHATVDELAAEVQRTMPDVSLSTIYRTLEALDEAGLVTHAHLHHGSPTYHSVDEEPHVHLVCTGCGAIGQQPISVAASLAAQLQASAGFVVDVSHLAVHGLCAGCLEADGGRPLAGSPGAPGALAQP